LQQRIDEVPRNRRNRSSLRGRLPVVDRGQPSQSTWHHQSIELAGGIAAWEAADFGVVAS